MYQEIENTKQLPQEDAMQRLDEIESQIHKNIKEIQDSTFVHCGNLDPDSCKDVHNLLLKEVERTRELILKNNS